MTAAQAIRKLRGTESQQVFATRLGMSIRALIHYEHGRSPSLKSVLLLIHEASRHHAPEIVTALEQSLYQRIPPEVIAVVRKHSPAV